MLKFEVSKTKKKEQFDIPILLIFFTRFDTTKMTFEKIREQKPYKLYLGSDGPRTGTNDMEKIEKVRTWLLNNIDWDCEVIKFFNDFNKGTKYGVSEHIIKFFKNEEMGIVLEDDCLPQSTFFPFCCELLYKYKDDERTGLISGNNFSFSKHDKRYSYFFGSFPTTSGWASWARVFKDYDVEIKKWPEVYTNPSFRKSYSTKWEYEFWKDNFQNIYNGTSMTWDYQIHFMNKINNRCAIMPTVNLVSNIGHGAPDAVYCLNPNDPASNIPSEEIELPLRHPNNFLIDYEKDDTLVNFYCFGIKRFFIFLYRKLPLPIKKIYRFFKSKFKKK